MPRFRKRPVVIEAIRWTGHNVEQILKFSASSSWNGTAIRINTPEGVMTADVGDWIIRGVKGEFYPCKPDIFAATYDQEPEDCYGG